MCTNSWSCCASSTDTGGHNYIPEHTQALLSQDPYMGCPTAPALLSTHIHTVLTDMCSIFQKRNNFFTDYFHTFLLFLPVPLGPPQISISLAAVFNMPAESINWWTHNKELVCKPEKHQIYEFVELKNHVSLCSPITFSCEQRFCIQAGTTINQTSTQS